jgi:hypothetical protein
VPGAFPFARRRAPRIERRKGLQANSLWLLPGQMVRKSPAVWEVKQSGVPEQANGSAWGCNPKRVARR